MALFVKLDVEWWDQPQIVQAGELAAVLLQRMQCHSQRHLTDGLVPAAMVWHWRMPRTQARLDSLVAAGLISPTFDAWEIVGWAEQHRTRAEVEEIQAKRREAGKQGGHAKHRAKQTASKVPEISQANGLANEYPELQSYRATEIPSSSSDSRAAPPGPAEEGGGVTMVELHALAGVARPAPNQGEVRTLVRAIANGWPADELRAMATRASLADVDPRAYLLRCLTRAISDPPPDAAPAEPRPLLHDQRTPCPNPACVDGWVGGLANDDGRPAPVERCPDCTGVRA